MHNLLPILSVENLSIMTDKHKKLVEDIYFQINPRKCLCIVGESGSGKSLTALSIAQLISRNLIVHPKSRVIWKQEQDLLLIPEKKMRTFRGIKIGFVFQDALSALNPVLQIQYQLLECFGVKSTRKKPTEQVDSIIHLLKKMGFEDPEKVLLSYPHQISGGQRQRILMAMALLHDPDLIIADEPTTALDSELQLDIVDKLKTHIQEKNSALLFITHDLDIARRISDDILVMKSGKMQELQTREAFFKQPVSSYGKLLLAIHTQQKAVSEKIATSRLPTTPLLSLRDFSMSVTTHKTDFSLFRQVNLDIPRGETVVLVGNSGSGKTSLLKALCGIYKAQTGSIILDNRSLSLTEFYHQ